MMGEPCLGMGALQSRTSEMIAGLVARRAALIEALTEVATWDSAADEVHRSIRVLAGAPWEIRRNAPRPLTQVTSFLPSNNILYSYVLFAMIPSMYAARVIARSSARVRPVTERVHRILADLTGGAVELTDASQRAFVRMCEDSDAVIFTGQPQNARQVMAAIGPRPRVLAFGSGPNPFVIGPDADVRAAVADLLSARLYNSGQDCLCPDVAFVHTSIVDEVADALCAATAALVPGDRRDPATRLAPIVYEDAVVQAAEFISEHNGHVLRGGAVDPATGSVEATVIRLPWKDDFSPPEFFSPVFCVVDYDDADQLARWFTSPAELERGMYASVYGEPGLPADRIGTTVVCPGRTTFDVEDGNRPFGGYGPDAGCVRAGDSVIGRPLLLSAEMRPAAVNEG